MPIFEPGNVIKTEFGAPIKIVKYLAHGGQGEVYIVEYGGKQKALKWYFPRSLRDPDAFYENLRDNAQRGSPDKAFLWPDAVTERTKDSFGYIMDLRPTNYIELTNIFASEKYNFSSFVAATEACIKITSAFRILHNKGYSYQDLNDGNFFIEPKSGDVLICDNDNVAPNGTNTGILGKPRYMAPEIVVGNGHVLPNTQSDRYSLAAILFLILFSSHPLEGKRWVDIPCMTDANANMLYGEDPLFMFDPNDKSNAPVRNIHKGALARWGYMPQYIKDLFVEAFSQQALKEPARRPRELDWLHVLVRFRSEILRCPCGCEVFIQNAATTKCDKCGKPITVSHSIKLHDYSMAAVKGSRVYRCQLGMCDADVALDPIALVVAKNDNPQMIGLKNMTKQIWAAKTTTGASRQVQPGEVIPFKAGIEIEVYGKNITLQ